MTFIILHRFFQKQSQSVWLHSPCPPSKYAISLNLHALSVIQPSSCPPLEISASSNNDTESPKTSTTKRSSSWSTLEETRIRIYKEEVEGLQRKGKKGQTLWAIRAEKLEKEMKALEVNSSRTPQRVKEKFFNLTRHYKQAKDKIKCSGA